jgi:type I restriction enzyme S subunit
VTFPSDLSPEFLPRRLKFLLAEHVADGPHTTPEFLPDGVPFLSVDGIQDGELVFDGCRYVSEADHREYRRKTAPRRDDLLMGKAASTGKIARVKVDFEFSIWSPLALLRVDRRIASPAFVEYALKSPEVQYQIDILCTSNTQKNISMDDIPEIQFPLPSLPLQRTIATFLDRKTAAIDALIAKKERLIELLQEKRHALITQAVTKGLDPSVPMKDSGVEWLGKIPADWEVSRIKFIAKLESGHTPDRSVPAYWTESNQIPWVSLNDTKRLAESDLIDDTTLHVNELGLANSSAHLLPAGVVVFTRDATIGKAAITTCPMAVSQHIIAWVCGPSVLPGYLLRVFYAMEEELGRFTMGATLRTIGMPDVKKLVTPVPPLAEQSLIVKHLEDAAARSAALIAAVGSQITALLEHRQALISAAVTGKIDIPGEEAA